MDVVLGDFMSSIGYRVKSLDNLFGDIKGKELCDLVIVTKCNSLPFFYQMSMLTFSDVWISCFYICIEKMLHFVQLKREPMTSFPLIEFPNWVRLLDGWHIV